MGDTTTTTTTITTTTNKQTNTTTTTTTTTTTSTVVQALIDDIRELRRRCMAPLRWGEKQIRLTAPKAEEMSSADVGQLATRLRELSAICAEVDAGKLPSITNELEARALLESLRGLAENLRQLQGRCDQQGQQPQASARPKGRATAPAEDRSKAEGKWLFTLLRHTQSELARRSLHDLVAAARRLADGGARVELSEVVDIPDTLTKAFDENAATSAQACHYRTLARHQCHLAPFDRPTLTALVRSSPAPPNRRIRRLAPVTCPLHAGHVIVPCLFHARHRRTRR